MNDLELLTKAAQEAGIIALRFWRTDQKVHDKADGAGPVSEGDIAVDTALREALTDARPDYAWLSEETDDDLARLDARTLFIVDPIDGTRAYVDGQETWAISAAIVRDGAPIAGVVYLPQRKRLYSAARGHGATLNGVPIRTGDRADPDGATVLASRPLFDPQHWRGAVPTMKRSFRPSLAYRLCVVAEGRMDAMLTLRPTWDWDIAAGTLIAEESGVVVTGSAGETLRFNSAEAKSPGCVAAPPGLHAALVGRLRT